MVERVVGDINKSNVFIVGDDKSCFVVDAGANLETIKNSVRQRRVEGILLTHAHYDHFFYVMDYAQEFGCQVFCTYRQYTVWGGAWQGRWPAAVCSGGSPPCNGPSFLLQ